MDTERCAPLRPIPSLIWVKRLHALASKLEFDNSADAQIVCKNELSEFCALLQAQRKQLLHKLRENLALAVEDLGVASQSKITGGGGLAGASAESAIIPRHRRYD